MSETIQQQKKFIRHESHSHYWIEDGILFESYNTHRGKRFQYVRAVFGVKDSDNVTEAEIAEIERRFLR